MKKHYIKWVFIDFGQSSKVLDEIDKDTIHATYQAMDGQRATPYIE